MVYGLEAKFGVKDYHVSGVLVYAIPNMAPTKKIMNKHELQGNVAFVDRGEIPLLDKILNIQRTEAIALIIVDDGQCGSDFTTCGHRIGSLSDGGFGAYDNRELWRQVTIPVLMLTKEVGDKLKSMMDIELVDIPGLGWQSVSDFPREDEF